MLSVVKLVLVVSCVVVERGVAGNTLTPRAYEPLPVGRYGLLSLWTSSCLLSSCSIKRLTVAVAVLL